MSKCSLLFAGMALSLLIAGPAAAQQSPPAVNAVSAADVSDEMVAARELVTTMRMTDQLKSLVPMLVENMKTVVLAGRPADFAADFEAIKPVLIETFVRRSDEMTDVLATVYSKNFTGQELRDMTAFYRTPTGQKLLQLMPTVAQESMQAGQIFGHHIAAEIKERVIEELRKRGHDI
jgi:uncharacterized protein